jgi:hypothetical protein
MKKATLSAALMILFLILLFEAVPARAEETDYTNASFARLTVTEGSSYIQRASDLAYEDGVVNTPIGEGDRLGTTDGRAEVYLGDRSYVRLDKNTKIDFLEFPKKGTDRTKLRLWAGSIYINVRDLRQERAVELQTADATFYILDNGLYRLDVKDGGESEILVFRGVVEASGEEGSVLVKAEQKLSASQGRVASKPVSFLATAADAFDDWNQAREAKLQTVIADRRLPGELADFEDELASYGRWVQVEPYGNVWVPNDVDAAWYPYHDGSWSWLPLCGWTWVPYEPWGWAPYHYGRWGWSMGLGWYWIPMSYWGPAWVDWWWNDYYWGWAPLSYWGYPCVIIGNNFYGRWRDPYYPRDSRVMTVVHKDQLKAKDISRVALSRDALRDIGEIRMSAQAPSVRPGPGSFSADPVNGNRFLLRKNDGSERLVPNEFREGGFLRAPGDVTGRELGPLGPEGPSPLSGERRIRRFDSSPDIGFSRYFNQDPDSRSESFLSRIVRSLTGRAPSSRGSSGSYGSPRSSGSRSSGTRSSPSRSSSSSRSSGSHPSGSVRKK